MVITATGDYAMFDPIEEKEEPLSRDMEDMLGDLLAPAIKELGATLRTGEDKLRFEASKLLIQLWLKIGKSSNQDDVISKEFNDSLKAMNRKLEGK